MKSKNNIISLISNNKKKAAVFILLFLCIGMFSIADKKATEKTNAHDIPLHDGDVLVTSDDITDTENSDTYFQELRATLDMDRNKIISMLTEAEATASTSEEKENASKEKLKLLEYMEQEKTLETLIKNKGLPESFVVITDSGANITVNTDKLEQSTVTKICELAMRQLGLDASEIVVQDAS